MNQQISEAVNELKSIASEISLFAIPQIDKKKIEHVIDLLQSTPSEPQQGNWEEIRGEVIRNEDALLDNDQVNHILDIIDSYMPRESDLQPQWSDEEIRKIFEAQYLRYPKSMTLHEVYVHSCIATVRKLQQQPGKRKGE